MRSLGSVAIGLAAWCASCSVLTDLSSLASSDAGGIDVVVDGRVATDSNVPISHCSDGKVHDFCDDFEGVGESDERWNHRLELVGTGSVALEVRKDAPSGSTTFSAEIARGDDAGVVHIARLSKQVSPWPRTDAGAQAAARIALSMFVRSCDVPADVLALCIGSNGVMEDTLSIEIERDASECRVELVEVYADEGGVGYARHRLATKVAPRSWIPVVLAISERTPWIGGGATVTLGSATESFGLASRSATPYFRADVGVSVPTVAGSATAVLYDDVRMDYRL